MKACKYPMVLMAFFLVACGSRQAVIEQPTPTALPPLPTSTATVLILPTFTATPTFTPTATLPTPTQPSATQVAPVATSSEQEVKIFLILLEDNGQSGLGVGCGDSVVPISVFIPPTQGVLKASMEKLLTAKQQFYGDGKYYNALYQSNLEVESVTIEQGKASVHLSGTVMLGGECDTPRFAAQIEQTALQFSTVTEVDVFINGQPLEEVLSLK
jgi:hypothetical protein